MFKRVAALTILVLAASCVTFGSAVGKWAVDKFSQIEASYDQAYAEAQR